MHSPAHRAVCLWFGLLVLLAAATCTPPAPPRAPQAAAARAPRLRGPGIVDAPDHARSAAGQAARIVMGTAWRLDTLAWPRCEDGHCAGRVLDLEVGSSVACVVLDSGAVACWGALTASGDTAARDTARIVPGLGPARLVEADHASVCVIETNDHLACWQRDPSEGAVDTAWPSLARVPLEPAWRPTGLALTDELVCVLTSAGEVACALRDAVVDETARLRVVGSPHAVRDLDAQDGRLCLLDEQGQVACAPTAGVTAHDGWLGALEPELALEGAVDLDCGAGDSLCVRRAGGEVACRGGEPESRGAPARDDPQTGLTTIPGVVGVAASGTATCALHGSGEVACWGDPRLRGEPLPLATHVDASAGTACAATREGIYCWGELDGLVTRSVVSPAKVELDAPIAAIAVDSSGMLWAATRTGDLYRWRHTLPVSTVPDATIRVDAGDALVGLGARGNGACAALQSGRVACVDGSGDHDLVGTLRWGHLDVAEVLADGSGLCARTADGAVLCEDSAGVLVRIALPEPALALGEDQASCAVGALTGTAWCWERLQGGSAARQRSLVPVAASRFTEPLRRYSGTWSTRCAVQQDGRAACWGSNSRGQLGRGLGPERLAASATSVPVADLLEVESLAVGEAHACAVHGARREVACWGSNEFGQLGDGSQVSRALPAPVPGLGGVVDLVVSKLHTCALTATGEVFCWGTGSRPGSGHPHQEPTVEPLRIPGLP